jgi:hypothetical protein
MFLAHLFQYQHDCHFFDSKIPFLSNPTPLTFSSVSHTVVVSSQPIAAGNKAFHTEEQRLPIISPFSSSNLQLPQSSYIISSKDLRAISSASTTISRNAQQPKTPTKKPQVTFDLHFSADYEPHYEKHPANTIIKQTYSLQSIIPPHLLKVYVPEPRSSISIKQEQQLSSLTIALERRATVDRRITASQAGPSHNNNQHSLPSTSVSELMLHSYQITPIYCHVTEPQPLTAVLTCVPYLSSFNVFFINLASYTVLRQTPGELWAGIKVAFGKLLSNVHSLLTPTKILFYTGSFLLKATSSDAEALVSKQEQIVMGKVKTKIDKLGSFQRQLWQFDRVDDDNLLFTLHQFEQQATLRHLDSIYQHSLIQHPTGFGASPISTTSSLATLSENSPHALTRPISLQLNFDHDDQPSLSPRNGGRHGNTDLNFKFMVVPST